MGLRAPDRLPHPVPRTPNSVNSADWLSSPSDPRAGRGPLPQLPSQHRRALWGPALREVAVGAGAPERQSRWTWMSLLAPDPPAQVDKDRPHVSLQFPRYGTQGRQETGGRGVNTVALLSFKMRKQCGGGGEKEREAGGQARRRPGSRSDLASGALRKRRPGRQRRRCWATPGPTSHLGPVPRRGSAPSGLGVRGRPGWPCRPAGY